MRLPRSIRTEPVITPLALETSASPSLSRLPMMDQLHEPLQNATTPRTVSPEVPAEALSSSILARREFLLGRTFDAQPLPASRIAPKAFISASLPETR